MGASRVVKLSLFFVLAVICITGFAFLGKYWKAAFKANIDLGKKKFTYVYIKTGSTYDDLLNVLFEKKILKNEDSFKWAVEKKNLKNHIYPGRYKIEHRMSNDELINMFRSGSQDPVNVTFNNIRTPDELAEKIGEQIEADPDDILKILKSDSIAQKYGFTMYSFPAMFIPNSYELYWNTSAEQFTERMYREYNRFWNNSRMRKLEKTGFSKEEVIILASIVQEESRKVKEKSRIAGLYINRLEIGMRLQADPTVKFAVGNFNIKRVLNKHIKVNSPYNTYKKYGLPPGPINYPEISTIDAVLNYEKHDYLYMCAKHDFSGYHNFAKTLKEHNRNKQLYVKELNKRKIYK
jgi:UPF0755 protein